MKKEMTCDELNKREFNKELKRQGYKSYKHFSGTIVYSKENLCEFSDEFKSEDEDLADLNK